MSSAIATNNLLWIPSSAWAAITSLAKQFYPVETGGMLVGYRYDDISAVVTNVIGPGPRALHRKMTFRPDHEYQQLQLDSLYNRSNGVDTYLGDWHTHPDGPNELSRKDMRVLRRIAESPESQTKRPIMLVVAGSSSNEKWLTYCVQYRSCKKGLLSISYDLQELELHRF